MRMSRRPQLLVAALLATLLPATAAWSEAPRVPRLDASGMDRTCAEGLAAARKTIDNMRANSDSAGAFLDWNALFIQIEDVASIAQLYGAVHPDKAVRTAAEECKQKYNALETDIKQDERLYGRVKAAKPADAKQAKLQRDLLGDFEDAGVSLPANKRKRAKEILDKLEEHRLAFERNVRDDPTKVTFSAEEMAGLPEAYLKARKPDAAGRYVLGLDAPSYTAFMANATSGKARERYYRIRLTQGGKQNLDHLNQLFLLRQELASLYDLPSFAHYGLRRKMAQKPENVNKFLGEVRAAIADVESRELEELTTVKAQHLGTPPAETNLYNWDTAFYLERLRRERHNVDQEKLRAYFPSDKSMDFTLLLAQKLYGLRFVEGKAEAWHPDVRYFEMFEADGKYLANFYVDLFPREGKRPGAFAAELRSASKLASRTPSAALVCNFNRQGFTQQELTTLLHELGHILNETLSNVDYAPQSLATVKWDFVEAPSQMFEEWGRREQTLALFREVCPECPRLTGDEVRKLEAARRFGQGIGYGRQWLLASYDMELSSRPRDPLRAWKELESLRPQGHVEGTMMPAAFGHIAGGYAAGYYGYMWSRVIARDLLSAFGDNLMDAKVAMRYRESILGAGVENEETDMVRRFLGRDPNPRAFFAEITGKE